MEQRQDNPDVERDGGAVDVNELQSEMEKLKGALQRAQADLVNYRHRAEAERNDLLKYANSRLLAKLLPALDEFGMALGQAPQGEAPEPWLEGFRLISRKLQTLLESEGVTRIEAQGREFDPSEHEALAQMESSDSPDGTVMSVIREGYRIQGRVLRPAQVIVATNAGAIHQSGTEDKEG